MTKEEFFQLAKRKIEIDMPSIFRLTIYEYKKDISTYRKTNKTGIWRCPVYSCSGEFSSKENAQSVLKKHVAGNKDNIQSALIERQPIDVGLISDAPIEWWLFDKNGDEVDKSAISVYHQEDRNNPDGIYFGREAQDIRFQPGDIVEIINPYHNEFVSLGIINDVPKTVEEKWEDYRRTVEKRGPIKETEMKFPEGYFGDHMSDAYFILAMNGWDDEVNGLQLMRPSLKVPKSAENFLKSAYQRWKENVDYAVADKISWDRLGQIVRGEA